MFYHWCGNRGGPTVSKPSPSSLCLPGRTDPGSTRLLPFSPRLRPLLVFVSGTRFLCEPHVLTPSGRTTVLVCTEPRYPLVTFRIIVNPDLLALPMRLLDPVCRTQVSSSHSNTFTTNPSHCTSRKDPTSAQSLPSLLQCPEPVIRFVLTRPGS